MSKAPAEKAPRPLHEKESQRRRGTGLATARVESHRPRWRRNVATVPPLRDPAHNKPCAGKKLGRSGRDDTKKKERRYGEKEWS